MKFSLPVYLFCSVLTLICHPLYSRPLTRTDTPESGSINTGGSIQPNGRPAREIKLIVVHPVHSADTIPVKEVIVTGFGTNRSKLETPASVAAVSAALLHRYDNTSFLPALNTIPGMVMEERSPGSYRISIRGSSIRSPYGIRNVKVYLDGIPFTDAGGNSNLNLLDFHTIGSIEVVKGPTGSMYGAGTGGAILLSTPFPDQSGNHISAEYGAGSYGMRNFAAMLGSSSLSQQTLAGYSELKSTGYRTNTALNRKEFSFSTRRYLNDRESFSVTGFYTDLQYQTPGALTLAEYLANPRQARPATAVGPSAVTQHAAIYRKELFTGLSHKYSWNEHWDNTSSFYLSGDLFANPFINNYERETEFGYGARTVTRLKSSLYTIPFRLQFGGEYQFGYASDRNYHNKRGIADSLTSDNELKNLSYTGFAQLEADLPWQLIFNAGLSYNHLSYRDLNLTAKPAAQLGNPYKPVVVPRVALLKKLSQWQSLYLSLSSGYSPPANAEVLESTGKFNTSLQAEHALTWELGFKGSAFRNILSYDLTLFDNQVSHTIVQRQYASGQTYFINEGSTVQKGLEASYQVKILTDSTGLIQSARFSNSLAINKFYFRNQLVGKALVSGTPLTGTAPYIATAGIDAGFCRYFLLNLSGRYSDRIPLNDANTVKSAYYIVFDGRLSYQRNGWGRSKLGVYTGIENALNRRYSLGNDLNGFGKRYYNAASGRNIFAGLTLNY